MRNLQASSAAALLSSLFRKAAKLFRRGSLQAMRRNACHERWYKQSCPLQCQAHPTSVELQALSGRASYAGVGVRGGLKRHFKISMRVGESVEPGAYAEGKH